MIRHLVGSAKVGMAGRTICLWAGLLLTVLAGLGGAITPAGAHQQKLAITTIEHNPRTGLIEVVHRIALHDAEHALRSQGVSSVDIVSDMASRREFARYVAGRFAISVAGGPIDLDVLGSEIDGGNLLIYQEANSPGPGAVLSVRSAVLTDIWASQVNRVNIGPANAPTTLVFRAGDRAKSARLQ